MQIRTQLQKTTVEPAAASAPGVGTVFTNG